MFRVSVCIQAVHDLQISVVFLFCPVTDPVGEEEPSPSAIVVTQSVSFVKYYVGSKASSAGDSVKFRTIRWMRLGVG